MALLMIAVAAGIGYSMTARAVSKRRTSQQDKALRSQVQENRSPSGDAVAESVGPIGKEWLHIPAAVAVSGYLMKKGAGARAVIPAAVSITAEAASRILDHARPHRRPPPGHPDPDSPSFPSGHANETTAVTLACAYVLARENLVPAAPAFVVATILSIASPAGRIYLDRHWVTDAIGGWCVGITIAAASAAAYEWMTPAPMR